MTIIPDKPVTLAALTSADFEETFEIEGDVSDGVFRLVVKRDAMDEDEWLVSEGDDLDVTVEGENTRVTSSIERETLLAALEADEARAEGWWELQWVGPGDHDGVWLEGKFVLRRGLK